MARRQRKPILRGTLLGAFLVLFVVSNVGGLLAMFAYWAYNPDALSSLAVAYLVGMIGGLLLLPVYFRFMRD